MSSFLPPAYSAPMQGKTLGIIGGGQCGTMFLHDFLYHYEREKADHPGQRSPVTVIWMDAKGAFGSNAAFDVNLPDSLLLSSPSYMITPSVCKPKLFHDFLQNKYQITNLETCLPRRVYGEFLEDLVVRLEKKAQDLGVTVVKTSTQVHAVSKTPDGRFLIEGTGMIRRLADKVALMPGPSSSTDLDYLSGQRGYISDPANIECFTRSEINFSDPSVNFLGFGPGNSFFDAVTLLENELGFRGKYILVRPEEREPWAITRERPIPDNIRYHLKHFVPEELPCPATYSDLSQALHRDLQALIPEKENPWRFGREYPLYYVGNFAMQFFKKWVDHHKPDKLAEAQSREAFRMVQRDALREVTSVVAPEALALYDRLSLEKRLIIISGRVLMPHIIKEDNYFKVPVRLNEDSQIYRLHLHGILNCMPFKRDWNTPQPDMQGHLLRKLESSGFIRKHTDHSIGIYDFTHALSNGIALTGAVTNPVWGVHLPVYDSSLAAQTLATVLNQKQKPTSGLRIAV